MTALIARGLNWEQHDWPNFRHDASSLAPTTREFFRRAGRAERRGRAPRSPPSALGCAPSS
ncbi:MAG: DUF4172 domain-containing protein [Sandaracinaceae bacterium]|nr:DUF4172 domain-containing protein [Sandaracinaceae bacterium]